MNWGTLELPDSGICWKEPIACRRGHKLWCNRSTEDNFHSCLQGKTNVSGSENSLRMLPAFNVAGENR